MKKLITFFISIGLVTTTSGLQAQTRSVARKPTATSSQPAATQSTPVQKVSSTTSYTRSQATPVPAAPATVQPTSVRSSPPVRPQSIATTRPATPVYTKESRIRLGFRLGVNSSLITGLDFSAVPRDLQPARVTGFHAGAVLNIGGPNFSVQPELLFSQYGIRMTSGSDYVQLKYNLLELPILLKASFGQSNVRVFINAGPVLAYTMNGTASLLDAGRSDSGTIDLTGTGRLSYGASGGSGVALKAGPGAVQLEARYTYLFSSNENNAKVNPQNFMVSAGYLIPLGGR